MKFEVTGKGDLHISIENDEDREALGSSIESASDLDHGVLADLLEFTGWTPNGRLYKVNPDSVGALTESPILTDSMDILDNGDQIVDGNVWWFPQYESVSFAEQLLKDGSVTFTKANMAKVFSPAEKPAAKDLELAIGAKAGPLSVTTKVLKLEGAALDWAVATLMPITVQPVHKFTENILFKRDRLGECRYSSSWEEGGPIIERERIELTSVSDNNGIYWEAWAANVSPYDLTDNPDASATAAGKTPLIAAMRAFVISKVGMTIQVPACIAPEDAKISHDEAIEPIPNLDRLNTDVHVAKQGLVYYAALGDLSAPLVVLKFDHERNIASRCDFDFTATSEPVVEYADVNVSLLAKNGIVQLVATKKNDLKQVPLFVFAGVEDDNQRTAAPTNRKRGRQP